MQTASRVGGARVSAYCLQLTPDVTKRSQLNDESRPGAPTGDADRTNMTKPMVRSAMRSGTTACVARRAGSACWLVVRQRRAPARLADVLHACDVSSRARLVCCAQPARSRGRSTCQTKRPSRLDGQTKRAELGAAAAEAIQGPVRWAFGRARGAGGVCFWGSRSATGANRRVDAALQHAARALQWRRSGGFGASGAAVGVSRGASSDCRPTRGIAASATKGIAEIARRGAGCQSPRWRSCRRSSFGQTGARPRRVSGRTARAQNRRGALRW
jgi:hypothetical protein